MKSSEPIAIIGLACQFPQAKNWQAFWRLLAAGKNTILEGSVEDGKGRHWETFRHAHTQYDSFRFLSFLYDDMGQFDANFFRISPLEAEFLDPQQRLLLETTWQALEEAGIDPNQLKGSLSGVYTGISSNEYGNMIRRNPENAPMLYMSTGNSYSTASGRVAFTLGLEGPALSIDVACASSLLAIHQAVGDLQRGNINMALAGGVSAILTSEMTESFASSNMLSPTGQCWAFDEAADGFVRGEGCGVVVLKRLSEAQADGDPIWGVIRGTASNQDGAGTGLTVPSASAQQKAIQQALDKAGLESWEVDYLEAHGTGTKVGDPIEASSAAAAYGPGRNEEGRHPLYIGSVKTNIGHLSAAAGVAGLIKVLLSMRHEMIPKHLNFKRPNPDIDWEQIPLQVTAEARKWPKSNARVPRAGVNSFGYSGTNAHVIVEGYQEESSQSSPSLRAVRMLPLSGRSEQALQDLASKYLRWLEEELGNEGELHDMAWTASVGRSHFSHRAGVVFRDKASLREGLEKVAQATSSTHHTPKIAFVYTGQGAQWAGMGRELYQREPIFKEVLDRCNSIFSEECPGPSLLEVLFDEATAKKHLHNPTWTQPLVYALECALTCLWRSVGVNPHVVLGHSLGEIAAAQAAGIFDLEKGLRFAARRGALMAALPEKGAMLAVFAPAEQVQQSIKKYPRLSIAADNGAHQTVSGPADEIADFYQQTQTQGLQAKQLFTDTAYHSSLVEPALDDLEKVIKEVRPHPFSSDTKIISSLSGDIVPEQYLLDEKYWRRQCRETVAFHRSVETLAELEVDMVVELGPHRVLGSMIELCWPSPSPPTILSSLLRPGKKLTPTECQGDWCWMQALGQAYQCGANINFRPLFHGEKRKRISLPSYPFQRQRHWVPTPRKQSFGIGHPLLGTRHDTPNGDTFFQTELTAADPEWLPDHRVFGRTIAPGALYATMFWAAGRECNKSQEIAIKNFQLHSPLVVPDEEEVKVQLALTSQKVEIFSRRPEQDKWVRHAEALISAIPSTQLTTVENPQQLQSRLQPQDIQEFYRHKSKIGINFRKNFLSVKNLWAGDKEALGKVVLPNDKIDIHPIILDGCFQVFSATWKSYEETFMPFSVDKIYLAKPLPQQLFCHAQIKEFGDEVRVGDLHLISLDGEFLGEVKGYAVKRATRAAVLAAAEGVNSLQYQVEWRTCPPRVTDFFPHPSSVETQIPTFDQYLSNLGVNPSEKSALLEDLEQLSWHYSFKALVQLGWKPKKGAVIIAEELRSQLGVLEEHRRLWHRILEILEKLGVLERQDDHRYTVISETMEGDANTMADEIAARYPHGQIEIGFFRRCADALAKVLCGQQEALPILFSDKDESSAADLYLKSPIAHAANRMLGDAVAKLLEKLPPDGVLRILEVGAGTGGSTGIILSKLPEKRFEYTYTDISAGFFLQAEQKFASYENAINYQVLDIERNPVEQGFTPHSYDLVIACQVLHATRHIGETLSHCRKLLKPSGQLMAVESFRKQSWLDLTFGQLDGWWRFADQYRPHHALMEPSVWKQAFEDAGFRETSILGLGEGQSERGVILGQDSEYNNELPGLWILAGDGGGLSEKLADELREKNQTVIHIRSKETIKDRGFWKKYLEELTTEIPFKGIVHTEAVGTPPQTLGTEELNQQINHIGGSALAMIQGLIDTERTPEHGLWLLTQGAQVLEYEGGGQLAGSILWGMGKTVAHEASKLNPRMIDLDTLTTQDLLNELLRPDAETHIAYRKGRRHIARLVKKQNALALPDKAPWLIKADPSGRLDKLSAPPIPLRPLGEWEVRVSVKATGLNFRDVLTSLALVDMGPPLGGEMCGYVLEVGEKVSRVSVGDRILGLTFGTFGPQAIAHEEMLVPIPEGMPAQALCTIPSVFVAALLCYDLSGLHSEDRVLIHSGAGGVGLAAIQLAQAAGAQVFATASAPKQDYLRSLGVEHVFDSRSSQFGKEILEATNGAGVTIVLNSLTGEGFIPASLSCLAQGGRFVELSKMNIYSTEEMAAVRPDVSYSVLKMDELKEQHPNQVGEVFRRAIDKLESGAITPLDRTYWPIANIQSAMEFMRSGKHKSKIILSPSPLASGELRKDRSYLVTGGLGGIGRTVAQWLADKGATTIILNGRRAPDPSAEKVISLLREQGITVQVELADMSIPSSIDDMLTRIRENEELPPLGGIIHSVGVISDGILTNQNWQRFEQVLPPKILGSWHLHQATMDCDLDMFVLFSSLIGTLGKAGQSNHAAANAFLDQLTRHRRSLGLPGQTIAWGAWSGLGEAHEQRERIAKPLAIVGGSWMSPEQGLRIFEQLVRQDSVFTMVADIDWSVRIKSLPTHPPFLEDLLPTEDNEPLKEEEAEESILSQLQQISPDQWNKQLTSFLQREVMAILRLTRTPEAQTGFFDLGMDSLMTVELRNRLSQAFDGAYEPPSTVIFNHPNIAQLADHIAEQLSGKISKTEPVKNTPTRRKTSNDIAIVGMACRFPGANNLQSYWDLLEQGRNAVTNGRPDDYHLKGTLENDPSPMGWGGFVNGIDQFDAKFFGITPIEARMMDPRQRMLLETCWQALENANIDPPGIKGRDDIGIYVGMGHSEYRELIAATGQNDSYFGTANSSAVGRIAFVLGLNGPAMPLDMSCASSLAAIHQAVAALQRGEIETAIVGGVNATLSPDISQFLLEYGMLSPKGQCRAFDAAADGFVRGEGCGVVILRRADLAHQENNPVWALVRGSAINQNGVSAGLTVPNGMAQQQVIRQALERAGVTAAEVDYLETQGTGSPLGDPIEAQAAADAYGQGRPPENPLLIGSVKGNIGHLESASGMASLIKVVLSMRQQTIPQQLNFDQPSTQLDWDSLPLQMNIQRKDWPDGKDHPPLAGVSAFGLSGSNAHVILEGHDDQRSWQEISRINDPFQRKSHWFS